MKVKTAPSFDNPVRTNFESQICLIWLLAGFSYLAAAFFIEGLALLLSVISGFCLFNGICFLFSAFKKHQSFKALRGLDIEIIGFVALKRLLNQKRTSDIWIGKGFIWSPTHTAQLLSILKSDWHHLRNETNHFQTMGEKWIHGLGHERPLWLPEEYLDGHALIVGTTGAGKTRLFDLLVTQQILAGHTVFIFDPKGDKTLEENARQACVLSGREKDFHSFHASRPDLSVAINPLADFSRFTEIASRIASLMPVLSSNDPFQAFGWDAVNKIAQALIICHKAPTLKTIRSYLEGGCQRLVAKTIFTYATEIAKAEKIPPIPDLSESPTESETRNIIRFYKHELMAKQMGSNDVEGIISLYEHDAAHFSKMVASLLPLLSMLTSGKLGDILSPTETGDGPIFWTMKTFIRKKSIVYIGLDTLSDAMVGAAIGSLFLADLTSVAGERYTSANIEDQIHVFIDEAGEIINTPLIQLLNKGRGAGFRLYIATQTFADFSARLTSKDRALQVLGNLNNLFALRTIDPETQRFLALRLPETRVRAVSQSQGTNALPSDPTAMNASYSERFSEEREVLFPAPMFGLLPNLEFLACLAGGILIKGRIPVLKKEGEDET